MISRAELAKAKKNAKDKLKKIRTNAGKVNAQHKKEADAARKITWEQRKKQLRKGKKK